MSEATTSLTRAGGPKGKAATRSRPNGRAGQAKSNNERRLSVELRGRRANKRSLGRHEGSQQLQTNAPIAMPSDRRLTRWAHG